MHMKMLSQPRPNPISGLIHFATKLCQVAFALSLLLGLAGCAIGSKKSKPSVDYSARVIELQTQLKRSRAEVDELRERNMVLERSQHVSRSDDQDGESSAPVIPSNAIDELAGESIGGSAGPQNSASHAGPAASVVPTRLPAKVSSSVASVDEKSKRGDHLLYSKVLESYRQKKSEELEKTVGLLLKTYPDSPFADNALYINGIASFEAANYPQALASMNRILKDYPNGNKAVSALFAKGSIERRMNHKNEARQSFLAVKKLYPGSPEAGRVAVELKILEMSRKE